MISNETGEFAYNEDGMAVIFVSEPFDDYKVCMHAGYLSSVDEDESADTPDYLIIKLNKRNK